MTYLQANKRLYQRGKRLIMVIVILLISLTVAMQLLIPHLFPSIISAIARPFWRMEFSIESGALKSLESLLSENESLRFQMTEAQVRLDTIRAIEQENVELKTLLGRDMVGLDIQTATSSTVLPTTMSKTIQAKQKNILKNTKSKILAAVLKRPPLSSYDQLIIDIGSDNGLSTTSLVYASGDVLIGRVIDVLGRTSKIKLFSSAGEKFEVQIGPQHVPATAIGRGGGQFEAQISREITINEGDFVINSSLNNKPFGVVNAVLHDPTQPFVKILFAQPINIYQLRWVLVESSN